MIDVQKLRGSYVYGLRCKDCGEKACGTELKNGCWIAFCRRCNSAQQVGGPNHGQLLETQGALALSGEVR